MVARIVGVGTANPKSGYSQEDILTRYGIADPANGRPAWRLTMNGVRTYYDNLPDGNGAYTRRPANGLYITTGGGGAVAITGPA